MQVTVDTGLCQDHAQCCLAAPGVFAIDPGGRLTVLVVAPDEEQRAAVEEAEQVCPMQAIRVEG